MTIKTIFSLSFYQLEQTDGIAMASACRLKMMFILLAEYLFVNIFYFHEEFGILFHIEATIMEFYGFYVYFT